MPGLATSGTLGHRRFPRRSSSAFPLPSFEESQGRSDGSNTIFTLITCHTATSHKKQIEFRIVHDCEPLLDSEFRHMFADRQRIRKLDAKQVRGLVKIFCRTPTERLTKRACPLYIFLVFWLLFLCCSVAVVAVTVAVAVAVATCCGYLLWLLAVATCCSYLL